MPTATVHRSSVGTYHPNPKEEVAWDYLDTGPACDQCGACECEVCDQCSSPICEEGIKPGIGEGYCDHDGRPCGENECIGLSFAYLCLDGGEALCDDCAEKEGVEIVPCDCTD